MLKLKGNNLGRRQQEINEEVIKTTSQNVDFNLIKGLEELSDVDRLYKIDVASVYKNIDYIIETLKCGDSLYISRALKCAWLYENENSFIINPDYLHSKVFPHMSIKMKKKMLSTISMYMRDEKRAENFYIYCLTDRNLNNIAGKFLIWTSEQHKMEFILNNNFDEEKLKYIIGNSFNLAEAYLAKEKKEKRYTNEKVHKLRYLTHISIERYLDLMEKYTDINVEKYYGSNESKLGLRLSKNVITKHKGRVLNNVHLYLKKLNLDIVTKYSSIEDINKYAIALLPTTAQEFWSMDFYKKYERMLKILPKNEVCLFLRQIFLSKYPNESFEMSKDFFNLNYYELFTNMDREKWALEHLKQNNEFFGPDKDYHWYKFVNFDQALNEIKKSIAVCTDHYTRADMVNVLLDSANNDVELEKLLSYYYERHVNESEDYKMVFIDNVAEKNNIFQVSENCWNAYSKILFSTNMFSKESYSYASNKYKTYIILYCLIRDKTIPKLLDDYVLSTSNAQNIIYNKHYIDENLTVEEIKLVYQKFIDMSSDQIKHLLATGSLKAVKDSARNIVDFALLIMETFEKNKDDCPDAILEFVKIDSAYYEGHSFFTEKQEIVTIGTLFRMLKLDSKLLYEKLVEQSDCFLYIKVNNLLKKIKIYFSNDVAKDWLSHCELLLEKSKFGEFALLDAIVIAIFHLASEDYKIKFISKYIPGEAKISHDSIDRKLLKIQEGICRFALYSRPPVPLEFILPYIKGDYVHFCLPMFNSYLTNLPMPQSIKFVSAILDTPVSVQKHGLRLAFQCFALEDLNNLIIKVWKSTKNPSLRMTIYKALYDKIENVDENSQRKLYEFLKMITSDLNENDDDSVFNLLTNFKYSQFKADFLQTAWNTVQNLSDQKSKNIQRKCAIVQKIKMEIDIIDKEFCRTQILDEFVCSMLNEKKLLIDPKNNNMGCFIEAKWELAAKYIVHFDNDQLKRNLELLHHIIQRCVEMWDLTSNGYYSVRKFLFQFIYNILDCSYCKYDKTDSIPVLEYIIKILSDLLPMAQIYTLYIKLSFVIISKKVMGPNECDYVHLIPENVASSIAVEVLVFLNNLSAKKLIYNCFYDEFCASLCGAIRTSCFNTNLNDDVIRTHVSSHLVEAQQPEAQRIALRVLPTEFPKEIKDVWSGVINKIQSGNNEEFQAYIYKHFIHNNFKVI